MLLLVTVPAFTCNALCNSRCIVYLGEIWELQSQRPLPLKLQNSWLLLRQTLAYYSNVMKLAITIRLWRVAQQVVAVTGISVMLATGTVGDI